MDWLEKRVTSDWMTLRENLTTPNRLRTMLKVEDGPLSQWVQALRQGVFEGPVEAKKKTVHHIFNFLAKLTRMSPAQGEILSMEGEIRPLIYVCAVENFFATGHYKPAREAETSAGPRKISVQEIFTDLQARIGASPELAKHPIVRHMGIELQMYKKEHQQFSQMSPTIPDDRAPQFFANFKARIDSIVATINQQYQDLLAEDSKAAASAGPPPDETVLTSPELSSVLLTQIQDLSRIRSTLMFALEDGYKFREPMLKLYGQKDQFLALLDQELKILDSRIPGGRSDHQAAIKMARNLAHYFETLLKPQPKG